MRDNQELEDAGRRLGAAVALSVLQDRADTHTEKLTVKLTKQAGTSAVITNE